MPLRHSLAGRLSLQTSLFERNHPRPQRPPTRPTSLPESSRVRHTWVPAALAGVALPSRDQLVEDLDLVVGVRADALVFLDLETTGFGAGPVAGIVGLAVADRSGLRVGQWTLLDAAGERAMLVAVLAELGQLVGLGALGEVAVVTYNGSSFDLPVLRSRCVRMGVDATGLRRLRHVDLLPVARRLYKDRWSDCRLATLERNLVGVHRTGDAGGAEVAEILTAALAGRPDTDGLRRAERHNADDVVVLAALTSALAEQMRRPDGASMLVRVARQLVRIGRSDAALERLLPMVAAALRSGGGGGADLEAVLLTARLMRARGEAERAAPLWSWVCTAYPGHEAAHDALAKDLEHRRRSPAEALAVAQASSAPCARRVARLRRKVAAGASSRFPETVGAGVSSAE